MLDYLQMIRLFFSVVNNASVSALVLNNDLVKYEIRLAIGKCCLTQILPNKQKRLFFKKKSPSTHPSLVFNNSPIEQATTQKHFGLTLDVYFLQKIQPILPQKSLLTIYKSFITPHSEYSDAFYDQSSNDAFSNKLETIQYNPALVLWSNERYILQKIASSSS